jgi:acyl-CoA synthetase (AMP-forming)/AMP-acid ligase II
MPFDDVTTLIQMLARRANESAAKTALTLEDEACSFQELWRGINRFASYLMQEGIRRYERVVIALPNSVEFFYAFYGVQCAGGIAVPLFPESNPERIVSIAQLCGAKLVVVPSKHAAMNGIEWITVEDSEDVVREDFPEIQADDVAFIQYTSGSTGNPKGVQLTHANLLTNIRQMIAGMQITEKDIFVSWLPVYHDMGLILKTMVPFYLAADVHLLPANLRSTENWLKTIHDQRATFTAAPDFAYRLLLRNLDVVREYDLRSLRVALNAAEPVRAATIREFEQAFDLVNVMVAGYGLAEATVGVSMWNPQTPARVDQRGLVSVGRPFPDIDVKILKAGKLVSAGVIGEILIKSIANTQGYFNNARATRSLFWRNGYIRSGDLGYLDEDGFLYIVGRKKNTIKHGGETIAPQELEETVDGIPNVRFSAAVGIDRGRLEGEQAYVFVEMREPNVSEKFGYDLTMQIVQAIHARLGFRPARVILLKPRSIPKTHNGKIQYARLREIYLAGTLKRQGQILYPDYG